MNENKYLVVGLGNIGEEYRGTRHNAGFIVADKLVPGGVGAFQTKRYGDVARFRLKNKEVVVVKPSTYMNLSGNAVRYWLNEESVPLENLLVVVDELALPFGTLRLKGKGSAGGHNGLKNIQSILGTEHYARLRFGIGAEFVRGQQIEYVLAQFSDEEQAQMDSITDEAVEIIKSFCLAGIERTMNVFNTRERKRPATQTKQDSHDGGDTSR